MVNSIVLVGRLVESPFITDAGGVEFFVGVKRPVKKIPGKATPHDEFYVTLAGGIACAAVGHLAIGKLVGIQGRVDGVRYDQERDAWFPHIVCTSLRLLSERKDAAEEVSRG